MRMEASDGRSVVRAVLGPTNTGKTHRAVERMLEHESGMIGLPLRLLAREVYDRITRRLGESAVALITGEEKRVPPHPRFWVCTVEAMPLDLEVDFLAIDEVQLAAHPERGHVFTDRLLRARGRRETWFLGADTMRPLVERILPTSEHQQHPRLSRLSNAGSVPLSALPPRTAVVAFSTPRVYELAERLRARRGGAAIVLGALSPRARNAQVALYQSGEVDYMVATDAIGMGLNLDVDLVAFAELRKFDGREVRALEAAELAQIAGRAGRHHNDGAFAILGPMPPLALPLARAIETHAFPAESRVWWRNHDLDMSSLESLLASLRLKPNRPYFRLAERASDVVALQTLMLDPAIRARARGSEAVQLLWDVCQVPDFRKLMLDDHARLVGDLFLQLASPNGRIASGFMEERVGPLDHTDGDIDGLLSRMAFIRTWTYVTSHARWVEHAHTWQERTRAIEDRLSDALHERLVQRFLDRSRPPRHRRSRADGQRGAAAAAEPRTPFANPFLKLAALRLPNATASITVQPREWIDDLIEAPHERFSVTRDGTLRDGDRVLGRLSRGVDLLHPEVLLAHLNAGAGAESRLLRRLLAWARDMVSELLAPLRDRYAPPGPATRGIVYQLERGLGTLDAWAARDQLQLLEAVDRRWLAERGVRVGGRVIYLASSLSARALDRRLALCSAFLGSPRAMQGPAKGAVSMRIDPALAPYYLAIGYPAFGGRAVRADVAEKAHARFARVVTPSDEDRRVLASWLGCPIAELRGIMAELAGNPAPAEARPKRRRRPSARTPERAAAPHKVGPIETDR